MNIPYKRIILSDVLDISPETPYYDKISICDKNFYFKKNIPILLQYEFNELVFVHDNSTFKIYYQLVLKEIDNNYCVPMIILNSNKIDLSKYNIYGYGYYHIYICSKNLNNKNYFEYSSYSLCCNKDIQKSLTELLSSHKFDVNICSEYIDQIILENINMEEHLIKGKINNLLI